MSLPAPPLIRRATRADQGAVLALYRQLRPDDPPLDDERLRRLWTEVTEGAASWLIVAEVDEVDEPDGVVEPDQVAPSDAPPRSARRVAGATCMLALVANLASGGRRIGLIEHVITASRFRRRGLARQMLEFALAQAWQADCCKVLLLSGAQRHEAHGLYEAVGFRGDIERGFVAKPPRFQPASAEK